MKKPTQGIERMREWFTSNIAIPDQITRDGLTILAYLDSIPEWPADLTRERLEELADDRNMSFRAAMPDRSDALRRLAPLAPKREKRKVALWEKMNAENNTRVWCPPDVPMWSAGWRKVGEAEIDA